MSAGRADSPPPSEPVEQTDCGNTVSCVMLGHYEDRCPGCKSPLGPPTCHFTFSTWRCMGCGALIDGRVMQPESVHVAPRTSAPSSADGAT